MIDVLYPLVQYLDNEFPGEIIYAAIREKLATQDNIPDDNIVIKDTGGSDTPHYRWVIHAVQIIVRDIDNPKAKILALKIYDKIHGVFGLILPQVVVDGEIFEQIVTQQINGIQRPFSIGVDDNGRSQYTTNYQLYYTGD